MGNQPDRPRLPVVTLVLNAAVALFCVMVAVSAPACLFMAFTGRWGPDDISAPGLLGAMLFPVPAVILIVVIWRAVGRRRPGAALGLGIVCLLPGLMGLMPLGVAVLALLGVGEPEKDFANWTEVLVFLAFILFCVATGAANLLWWRRLTRRIPESAEGGNRGQTDHT